MGTVPILSPSCLVFSQIRLFWASISNLLHFSKVSDIIYPVIDVTAMKDTIIKIQMLGGFSIVSGETRFETRTKRATKTWMPLQYLIAHRYKAVPQEELLDVFWPDNGKNSPGSSMRIAIHRIREALEANGFPDARNMIVCRNGCYEWNKEIECVVDAEEFESLCQRAGSDHAGPEEKLELLLEAAGLYGGDFLPNAAGELWAMRIASYYRSLYINCARTILGLLTDAGRHDEAELFCTKALRVDPFDEIIHEYHILSLLAQRKHPEAVSEYRKMEALFYNELGVAPAQSLRSLYRQIHQPAPEPEADGKQAADDIVGDWLAGMDFSGAYYCDIEMFKAFCRIEALSVDRSGKSVFIISFDVNPKKGKAPGAVMDRLGDAISKNLRRGDIFTRSGPAQYILMPQSLSYEDCKNLPDRIYRSLGAKRRPSGITATIQPIQPS